MIKRWDDLKCWPDIAWTRDGNVYPPLNCRFRAFELTPYDRVRVVILGQDPYHTQGVADGLAFSTFPHIKKTPPSLGNILREYSRDLGYERPRTNSLEAWARNGVLLLNTLLTVQKGKPGSHIGMGWEKFTLEVFKELRNVQGIVYMLWGKQAQEYMGRVDSENNLVLCAGHPSPLNRSNPFVGSGCFTKSCDYMQVDKEFWKLP